MHMQRMHMFMGIMAAIFFMVLSPFLSDGGIITHSPPSVNRFGMLPIVFSLYCQIVRYSGASAGSSGIFRKGKSEDCASPPLVTGSASGFPWGKG